MTHALVTLAVPFDAARADAVDRLLEDYALPLRDSAHPLRAALRRQGIHFMSVTVVRGDVGEPTHLMLEAAVDGEDADFFRIVGTRISGDIVKILGEAGIEIAESDVESVLRRYQIRTGQGLFDIPGLDFVGTPGMSATRILDEYELAREIRDYLDREKPAGSPLENLLEIRAHVAGHAALRPLLSPAPVAAIPVESGLPQGIDVGLIAQLALPGIVAFFWPLLLVLAAAIAGATWIAWPHGPALALGVLGGAAILALGVLALVLGFVYCKLRALEAANQPDDSLPDRAILEDVTLHEDWSAQNHLAGVSIMQPGRLRRLTLRIAFWGTVQIARRRFRPGFLGEIGSIHFARWVLLPNTNKLLFFSNYGGSWGSYLEDFITKAAIGLTGIWSNTAGFPRTENLFLKGATDGDRFKRWARRQQRPTRFWYSAYPRLTTARIRANAALRQGLASACTEDEAQAWFSLIGSASRPAATIETSEVQCLLFGGLKRHPFAACLLLALPPDRDRARAWLKTIASDVTFGDAPPPDLVRILGLSASGFARLQVGDDLLGQFPLPFLLGMSHPSRANILADTGDDKPATWLWGGRQPVDAVLTLYGASAATLDRALAETATACNAAGARIVHRVRLADPASADGARDATALAREPFGFADSVSQPVIRGLRPAAGGADAIHLVEPGEFLLGYPDNRGYLPPSPTVPATADPWNRLAVAEPRHSVGYLQPNFTTTGANADRDFGRNGAFLVVRQLEQDVPAFEAFLADAATRYAGHPGVPAFCGDAARAHARRADWFGAKIVGRWKDGTSLARFPLQPGTGWAHDRDAAPDNDFLPGVEDPGGLRCPFGAHIRRANPRDSFRPGSTDQLAIVNRHRILRRGRRYDAAGSGDPAADNPGLLFMCLNADIERQFEFIQQTWSMAPQFHGLDNEVDPVLGRGKKMGRLTIPTPDGPVMVTGVQDFVRVRGGEYFFLPSRRALRYLAGDGDR